MPPTVSSSALVPPPLPTLPIPSPPLSFLTSGAKRVSSNKFRVVPSGSETLNCAGSAGLAVEVGVGETRLE